MTYTSPAGSVLATWNRPLHYLLQVLRASYFVVPLREPSDATALVDLLLNPVDAHVLAAGHFTLKGVRRATGAKHDSCATSLCVVDSATDRLGAGIYVYEQHLRATRNHEVAVSRGHTHFFVQAEDRFRDGLAAIYVLGEAFLDGECVSSGVYEQIFDVVR